MAAAEQQWRLEPRMVVVTDGPKGEKVWVPTQKTLYGQTWTMVSKWDRGFVKFVTGKALNLKKNQRGADCNVTFLDELKRRRQEVCDKFMEQALQAPEEDEDGPPAKRARTSQQKRVRRDTSLLPDVITLTFDEVVVGGKNFPKRDIQLLTESIHEQKFWVECTQLNLEYIKAACLASSSSLSRKGQARAKKGAPQQEDGSGESDAS